MPDLGLQAAIMDIKVAESNFNNATEKEDIDRAIYQLIEAEEKFDLFIQKRKDRMKA